MVCFSPMVFGVQLTFRALALHQSRQIGVTNLETKLVRGNTDPAQTSGVHVRVEEMVGKQTCKQTNTITTRWSTAVKQREKG